MLPAAHRLTDGETFRLTTRQGRRASSKTLVTHLVTDTDSPDFSGRVGFVVGKSVGNSVVRHRVQRRLRHLVREAVPATTTAEPGSGVLVVRALPAAASADRAQLDADLRRCLRRSGCAL